jgi:hypothetical protein
VKKRLTTARAMSLRGLFKAPTAAGAAVSPFLGTGSPTAALRCILVAAALLLASCSATRIAYDNFGLMSRFMLGRYVDLDTPQADALKPRIAGFHQWHRANEMPVYAAVLHSASRRAAKGITAEDVEWSIANVRLRFRAFAARAAEEAAPVLVTLEPVQLAALEHKFAEDNEKYAREYLAADDAKRRRAQLKRAIGRFSEFAGDLTDEQEARVARFLLAHERHVVLRFEDRQHWQRDALALLREHREPHELGRRLAETFTRPELRRSEEFVREDKRWEQNFAQLVVDLDRSMSARQRASVVKRLQDYADDAAVLSGKRGEAA